MGCFLACFGFSKKRKRPKQAHKRYGNYEPLDSSITIVRLSSAENPTTKADSEPRHKPKEQPISKIRKKVRFNLNVQTYEPISTSYHFLEDEEDEKMLRKGEETAEECLSTSKGSFNLNYRYQNCRDFFDEEDDIAFEDSDLYDDDDYNDEKDDDEYDGDIDIGSQRASQDGFSEEFKSSSTSSEKKVSCDKPVDEKANTSMHSVLKPVENLTQWRAAKAKTATSKQERKENLPLVQKSSCTSSPFDLEKPYGNQSKPLLQEISVDSSFSSWLNSTST